MNTRELGHAARSRARVRVRARARRHCLLPRLEPMEERVVPASLVANDVAGLVAAIVTSNSNGEDDTITLVAGKTYTLTSVDNTVHGPTGLPVVGEAGYKLTIVGAGATIARDSTAPAFRLLDVASQTTVELVGLTLTGGRIEGAGGAARGGGIHSLGNLTLVGVTVADNHALGDDGDWNGPNDPSGRGSDALGGGIYSEGGVLVLTGETRVEGNQARGGQGGNDGTTSNPDAVRGGDGQGGGVYVSGGAVTLSQGATVSANTAAGGAGGLTAVVGRTWEFGGTGGDGQGGGVYVSGGAVTLSQGATVSANTAAGGKGGLTVAVVDTWKTWEFGGTGGDGQGGGVYASGGAVTLSQGATVSANTAAGGKGEDTRKTYIDQGLGGDGGGGQGGGVYTSGGALTLSQGAVVSANTAVGGVGGQSGKDLPPWFVLALSQGAVVSANTAVGGVGGPVISSSVNGGDGGHGQGGGVYAAGGAVDLNTGASISANAATGGASGTASGLDYASPGDGGSGQGGGVYTSGATVTLRQGAAVTANTATGGKSANLIGDQADPGDGGSGQGGGVYAAGGTIELTTGASISGNAATGGVSGIARSYFSGLHSGFGGLGQGGGVFVEGGSVALATGTTISVNSATGGAVGTSDYVSPSVQAGDGGDGQGGGIHASDSSVSMGNASVAGNTAVGGVGGGNPSWKYPGDGGSAWGGGLYLLRGSLELTGSLVAGNMSAGGVGGSDRKGGTARGGGLYVKDGSATLSGVKLAGNRAQGAQNGRGLGGGSFIDHGTLSLAQSTIEFNSANGAHGVDSYEGPGGGGGVYLSASTATVSQSSFLYNAAAGEGGGLSSVYDHGIGSRLQMTNCTAFGNTATHYGGFLENRAEAILTSCTVSANSAGTHGGGIDNRSFISLSLVNTIVANNWVGAIRHDVAGTIQAASRNNLIGVDTKIDGYFGLSGIGHGVNGNIIGTAAAPIDPLLSPLGDHGGPTRTMALLPGSPAIDVGATGGDIPATDQRGMPRHGVADIGAFESQGFTLTVAPAGTPRQTVTGTVFTSPLVVRVRANDPLEPVDGGIIWFGVAPAANGASAVLSSPFAVIAGGEASMEAVANTITGGYWAWAQCPFSPPAWFFLENVLGRGGRGR